MRGGEGTWPGTRVGEEEDKGEEVDEEEERTVHYSALTSVLSVLTTQDF